MNAGSRATVFVNVGDGSFPRSFTVDAGFDSTGVTSVDLDADHLPDLVVTALTSRRFVTLLNRSRPAAPDENDNHIPDRCEQRFHRGDVDGDGRLQISDAQVLFSFAFSAGQAPSCAGAVDSNDDRRIDIADGIFLLNFLFRGGPPPPLPGGPSEACGVEPARDDDRGPLGCEDYRAC